MTALEIQLDGQSYAALSGLDGALDTSTAQMAVAAGAVLRQFGLPPEVSATIRDASIEAVTLPVVSINGLKATIPEHVFREARAFASAEDDGVADDKVSSWIINRANEIKREPLAVFFGHVAGSTAELNPSLLATTDVLDRVIEDAITPANEEARAFARSTLKLIIGVGAPVAQAHLLAGLDAASSEAVPRQIMEEWLAAQAPAKLAVRMPTSGLRQVSSLDPDGVISTARTQFAKNIGIPFPAVRFVADDTVPPNCFSFEYRGVSSQPRVGFGSDQQFVSSSSSLSFYGAQSSRVLHPMSREPGALIAAPEAQLLGEDSLALNALQYVVECLAVFLTERALRLFDNHSVANLLDAAIVAQLVVQIGKQIPDWIMTGVLRNLVASGVSIHDSLDVLHGFADAFFLDTPAVRIAIIGEFTPRLRPETTGDSVEQWTALVRNRLRHPLFINSAAAISA